MTSPRVPESFPPARAGLLAWLAVAGLVLASAGGAALFAGAAQLPAERQLSAPVTAPPYRLDSAGVTRPEEAKLRLMLPARVLSVVDGDTVRLEIAERPAGIEELETVRLIGVDTPETKAPGKPVQRGGPEASAFVERRLLGRDVLLAFDRELRDRYGRLLAYVWLTDGTCFNALLVAEGVGRFYGDYPFALREHFRKLGEAARQAGKGIHQGE
jgi:micrococcal nuclease